MPSTISLRSTQTMRAVFFVVLMFSCRSGTSAISTVPEPLPREVSAVADARWVVGIRGTSAWQISKILPADFACLSTFFVDGAVTVGFDLAMRVKGTICSPAISDVKKVSLSSRAASRWTNNG